jgi:hypothetical protein
LTSRWNHGPVPLSPSERNTINETQQTLSTSIPNNTPNNNPTTQQQQQQQQQPTVFFVDKSFKLASVNKYLDITIGITILAHFLETTLHAALNAAITIFGIGVGVGLILGDSCRAAAVLASSNHHHQSLAGVSSSSSSSSSSSTATNSQLFQPYTYTLSSDLPAQ